MELPRVAHDSDVGTVVAILGLDAQLRNRTIQRIDQRLQLGRHALLVSDADRTQELWSLFDRVTYLKKATIDLGGRHTALFMGTMNMAGCLAGVILPLVLGNWFDQIRETGKLL